MARLPLLASAPFLLVAALGCGSQLAPAAGGTVETDPESTPGESSDAARERAERQRALARELSRVAAVEPGAGRELEMDPWPDAPPAAGSTQVAVWRDGAQVRLMERTEADESGLMVLDVGTEWVPAIFRSTEQVPHAYQAVFTDLANGRFADDPQGRRAKRDRHLELYGIPPSPALLARRYDKLIRYACTRRVPDAPLRSFEGVAWPEGSEAEAPRVSAEVVRALQARLACEAHLRGRPSGTLDAATRRGLEEFERRNRIYARGTLDGDTLAALHSPPLELERRALLRTLTERMLLDLGVIEDGSAELASPEGSDVAGRARVDTAPNVEARIERAIADALGLHDVDGMVSFYRRQHDVFQRRHYRIAIPAVELPAYYGADMDLFVEIDRGDVYYDFPYDEDWKRREQPIQEHPTLTLYARTADGDRPVVIPLARYGTTIGGWRVEHVGGRKQWTYKESPTGKRVWQRIDSTPVWLPPAGTPAETLVYQSRGDAEGEPEWEVNENIVGPGYASAYGLVAAYHQRFEERADRRIPTLDEGIRSHGSSDYTSIWQRASHGCHRLHNHLAIRLFSFILAHRAHGRAGHRSARYRMPVSVEGFSTEIVVDRTGYAFELAEPLPLEVLKGEVRGELTRASRKRVTVNGD